MWNAHLVSEALVVVLPDGVPADEVTETEAGPVLFHLQSSHPRRG